MNRVALVAPLALILSTSAAAQLAVRAAHQPAPSAAVSTRLAALDPAGTRLAAAAVAPDGTLRRLVGPLQLAGATLDERAADFVARYAPLFGADATVQFGAARPMQPRADGSPRALRLPQAVHGWEVDGAGLLLTLDEQGRATGATGFLSKGAAQLAPPTLAAQDAVSAALAAAHLDASRVRGAPSAQGLVLAGEHPALAWRVRFVNASDLSPWRVDVDANGGGVLSARLDRCTGVGNIVLSGLQQVFPTGNGSGGVYSSVSKALTGSDGIGTLPELTLNDIDQSLALLFGTLTGRYTTVSDLNTVLLSTSLMFDFSDTSSVSVGGVIPQSQAFDHVNTYAWISRTAKFYGTITGTLSSDTCVPAIVNFDNGGAGFLNAFFTPDDLDGAGPFAPGYFVFGEVTGQTGDPMDDFSRDPTIVSHEYFHCMADFAGLSFGDDALDTPPRAVNEAIADYGAATFLNTPLIGKALVVHLGPDLPGVFPSDALRNLTNEITLTDNLFDTVDASNGNLPEEHEAGKIFGCALWRLRTTAKSKTSNNLVVNSLATWPQSSADVGFPTVTAGNAQAAYEAFDFECFLAMANAGFASPGAKGWKNVSNLLGAFLTHGITGSTPGNVVLLPTDTGKETLAFSAAFLGTETDHVFDLALKAGQQITITLVGDKTDATQIDFAFVDGPAALGFPNAKVVNATGTKVTQKGIVVNADGTYVLDLFTHAGAGAYKATIKIK